MTMSPEVFISFAYKDGLALARELEQRLRQAGIETWFRTRKHARRRALELARSWRPSSRRACGFCSWSSLRQRPSPSGSRGNGRSGAAWASTCSRCCPNSPSSSPIYARFPRWIREHDHWKDPSQRERLVLHILSRPAPPRPAPFRVPDLPRTYVQRIREYTALGDMLLDAKRENPVAVTAAICGGGGFGKSTLAKVLCHDEQIYDAFTDGIVWVELGPDAADTKTLAGLRSTKPSLASRRASQKVATECAGSPRRSPIRRRRP